jgi:hypothetical protein
MKKLNTVNVKFEDAQNNYSTNVSGDVNEDEVKQYFIGTYFNCGAYPDELMYKCIDVEFIDNNLKA